MRGPRRQSDRCTEAACAGMVLIELTAVISVTALLLAIVVTVFTSVYRIDRSWSDSAAEHRELQRLAAYFREDAHRAEDIQIAGVGRTWSFVYSDEQRTDYEVLEDTVRRTGLRVHEGEATPTGQQEPSIPSGAEVKVERTASLPDRLVELTVWAKRSDGGRQAVLRVNAQVGRFRTNVPAGRKDEGSD